MQFGPDWAIWSWLAIDVVSIVAAILVRLSSRPMLSVLQPHHVAAAAIVGVITWGHLLQLPNTVQTVFATYAGIANAPNQGLHRAFAAGQAAAVITGALAVIGLVRRRGWAVPLAAGACLAALATATIGLVNWFGIIGENGTMPGTEWLIVQFALQPAPAVAGIVLLAWPFIDGSVRPTPADGGPRTPARDGIVHAEPEEAVGVEWPDWRPAQDRG